MASKIDKKDNLKQMEELMAKFREKTRLANKEIQEREKLREKLNK